MNAVQKKSWKKPKRRPQAMDYSILFLVLFLVGFGLVILYSTSSYKASLLYNDTTYWVKKQALFAAMGICGMLFIATRDYHIWQKKWWFAWVIYGGVIGLLLLTFAIGAASHGSQRWISIGPFSLQPSELAKIGIILFLAAYISSKSREMRQWKKMVIPFLFAIPIIVIVGIENLSTCIILLAISFIMIFVATPLLVPFVVIGLIGVAGAGGLLLTQGYRMERITVWLDPAASEKGHQTIQGLYAIGSGGLFGKGLGQSMQKLGFLPEANNDMIFSVICEELGLFGVFCADMALYGDCRECTRSLRFYDCCWSHCPYRYSGIYQHCSCNKHDSQYRNPASIHKLWRKFVGIYAIRDGTGAVSIPLHKREKVKDRRKRWGKEI